MSPAALQGEDIKILLGICFNWHSCYVAEQGETLCLQPVYLKTDGG